MSGNRVIMFDAPALLEFRGTDALRYLNGQLTQDVRKVVGTKISVPSCVTDAKGKLQFRVTVISGPEGALWVEGLAGSADDLEARLTRYLIADDVEVADLTGKFSLMHFLGAENPAAEGVIARESHRYGVAGWDWWCPSTDKADYELPANTTLLGGDELEAFRIKQAIPKWGHELREGMLPPEALLDATDISYQKGCYVGQEVISRIKSAGKVNRRLSRFTIPADFPVVPGLLENGAGELTSVSPIPDANIRYALGYVKRGVEDVAIRSGDGVIRLGKPS